VRSFALWGALALLLVACGSALPSVAAGQATLVPGPSPVKSATPTASVVSGPMASPGTSSTPAQVAAETNHPTTLRQLIGQKLVVRMTGTTPSAALLGRIQRGEIGGVVLFGDNITSAAQLQSLTAALQAAARAGGRKPLLISTDQEGGSVKRIPWIAPTLSPPQMGATGLASVARAQGAATGSGLLGLGINCDLAPVADVPASTSSFMYQDGRTWSFDATTTARLSVAFARGLRDSGVVPVMKHFPGLGFALRNTDTSVVTLSQSATRLLPGLQPYQLAVTRALPMVMLSNATYTAYDRSNGAGWSPWIINDLLRGQLGFTGVTITDSLSGTAKARGVATSTLAIRAAIAGTDMIMLTGSEAATARDFDALLAAARAGTIPRATLEASYQRISTLKAALP
jgi:beta-N-acetylhexosaminidase